jgi:HK97 family phage prohead protease
MEADFSGYATKANLKCADGRTIMPDAFKHQDKAQVPLVWMHGHTDPENVLGHAILEAREDGVYAHAFFNNTPKAQHMKEAVKHRDVRHMSIWANELLERAGRVMHGAIREVSLVLNGANPGALIEPVTIRHSNGDQMDIEDEAVIYTGLELILEHGDIDDSDDDNDEDDEDLEEDSGELKHADGEDDETIADIYDSMTEKQKDVLHYMIGEAISAAESEGTDTDNEDTLQQDNMKKGDDEMGRSNVFEKNSADEDKHVLSHSDIMGIVKEAGSVGSMKKAVESYALSHGITDIDILFPDAQNINDTPEWYGRRTDWVAKVLGGCRKSPFARIKTVWADITEEEARAKGYLTGNLKKEEMFQVAKRSTTPTTIYKKQKLDRDDMIDITDFDVVTWLKGEMRLMLDEELARAILIGDGRDISSDDKVNEQNIRPIAKDHELYTTQVNVNIDDNNSSVQEIVDAIVMNRKHLRGTGLPTMYTTETYIAKFLLLKDTLGRRIYKNLEELASELRVAEVVSVEVMEEEADLVAVLVNPVDYVIGANRGGEVGMFEDFDIDYNQQKYLIETRVSGALTKLKAAMVVRKVASNLVAVVPAAPAFDGDAITITNQTGVVYKNATTDATMNAAGSPYAVADGVTLGVYAVPDTGYYFPSSEDDSWSFTGEA